MPLVKTAWSPIDLVRRGFGAVRRRLPLLTGRAGQLATEGKGAVKPQKINGGDFKWKSADAPAPGHGVQKGSTNGLPGAEGEPGFFGRLTRPIVDRAKAVGNWGFSKLPEGAQKKLIAANDWRVKNKLNLGTLGNVANAGMMAYFAGQDLANGESIGSVAGNLAGFYAGSRLARRFLPKGESALAGAGRFLGDMGAGIAGSIGLQYLGDKYMPIGRLAKPVDEYYGTGPEMTKGAEENSMNKYAMIKEAEVGGVLAAFTDAGLMQKFAEDDFALLTEKVAENLGDSYTVDDIAVVADALLSGGVEKTAEEVFIENTAPIMGYALMAKLAGEMDEDDLDDFVSGYFEGAGF